MEERLKNIVINSLREHFRTGGNWDIDGTTIEVVTVPNGVQILAIQTDDNGEPTDRIIARISVKANIIG